jgi:ATP-dependent Lhr-like helicase
MDEHPIEDRDVNRPESPLSAFQPPVRAWFAHTYPSLTRPQSLGWPAIRSGGHTLILAATGSGKTLTAFLSILDRVLFEPPPERGRRCRVLYVSPLKALAVDIEKNLRAPIQGIVRTAADLDLPVHMPTVAIRTGDTPGRERAAFQRRPADILITTPESLYLLLTSAARETLRSIRWVIVDEIHTMVATKRGAHLALSLERLARLTDQPFQRIGLSATQRPLEEAAQFLGGFEPTDDGVEMRHVQIVDASGPKRLDLQVRAPAEVLANYPVILELIRAHRSTLVFVNSRRLAERLAAALNDLAGEEIVRAHHGSIAREQRLRIEDDLKLGRLPALVATSSLELGIDMGAIDLVVQVDTPPGVASGLQRIGRAGHRVDAPSEGVILPRFRGELPACAALVEQMLAGAVEPLRMPRNPLDVLAQQIVAICSIQNWPADELFQLARSAAPFSTLTRPLFDSVLDMLSGKYPSHGFSELRPRVTWDRDEDVVWPREGARRVVVANPGTIPDRGHYGVYLIGAEKSLGRVGELDEEMVFESRVGDTFLLGASSWRIEEITYDRVIVSPAAGTTGRMPFWHGEMRGRPAAFGRAIGALARRLEGLDPEAARDELMTRCAMEKEAATSLLGYLDEQRAAGGAPDDRTLIVERYRDELGDWRVCLLSPLGAQIHAPWAMAIAASVYARTGSEIDVLWLDDGIVARFPDTDEPPPAAWLLPDPEGIRDLVVSQLSVGGGGAREIGIGAPVSALFASTFREAAGRALLLPRRRPGQRAPLWQQRKRAADLLKVAGRFGSFPIVLETFREILQDRFDMPALEETLRDIRDGAIEVRTVTRQFPSPFAAALLFHYVANFMYEGDAPIAERRAQALTVDPAHLRELLGDGELRELLDPEILREYERYLQHLSPDRSVRHADGLHDLLLRIGDLRTDEIAARSSDPSAAEKWTDRLISERRCLAVTVAGESRLIAVEDAARYREALGVSLPPGLPESLVVPAEDALEDLLIRYARTHGPFAAAEAASRFGLPAACVTDALEALERAGRVLDGAFRPGGDGREWCDAGVLKALRQKSLARLRQEVEPVDASALGRFCLAWQGVAGDRRRSLADVIAQLQDVAMPASVLESEILPARLPDYDPRELDALMAAGEVIWVGRGSLGQRDGRIALYLTDDAPALLREPTPPEPDEPETRSAVRALLAERGASFFGQIHLHVGGMASDVVAALWDLVWMGEATNDTLHPLRARVAAADDEIRIAARRAALARSRARSSGYPRSGRTVPQEAAGRWSLVRGQFGLRPDPTERLAARTRLLLARHGLVTRDVVPAEGLEGGYSALYPALRAMEEAGKARRGYFVAGLGASQFAHVQAVDRLRAVRDPADEIDASILSATDPANPYGAALPWPETRGSRRPMRIAGAHALLIDGAAAAWLSPGFKTLLAWPDRVPDRAPEEAAACIAGLLADEVTSGRRRALLIEELDAGDAHRLMRVALLAAGFHESGRGYLRRL